VNLLPHFEGETAAAPHEALYWRFGPQTAIRMGDWKLVRHRDGTALELYNLKDDISESRDLAASQPEKVKQLKAAWDAWNAQLAEPRWKVARATPKTKKKADR
jgi:arylsulfatase A-like enzyme